MGNGPKGTPPGRAFLARCILLAMNLAERLGHSAEDRILLLNADDMASTHASNMAVIECLEQGSLTSSSILVPAAWFCEAAEYAREHPQADIGLHLTLTCEYSPYRWRAISDRSAAPGLYDDEGFLWRTSEEALEHASFDEAETELRAQIETALAAGIDVTHLDTHMGTVVEPKFIEAYVSLGLEYGTPLFIFRPNPERLKKQGREDLWAAMEPQLKRLDEAGFPVLDHILIRDMGTPKSEFVELFSKLRPGVTHFLVHPAKLSGETQAIAQDAPKRNADYENFRDRSMAEEIARLGIKTITYREIRDAYRQGKLRS